MLGFFKTRVETLVACHGRVACPLRGGDTDIEVCFECPRVRGIVQQQEETLVRCAPAEARRQEPMRPRGFRSLLGQLHFRSLE
jgi:hypothetical protein